MRISAVAAAFAVAAFCVTTAFADQDPVTEREHLMKENFRHWKSLNQMTKGQASFDAGAVAAAFAQWADTASKFAALFPDDAKTGGDNRAAPKIWENKKDFEEHVVNFAKVVAENRDKAKTSLDGLKASFPAVNDACDGCHKEYRLARK
jgi:cytochrome c556